MNSTVIYLSIFDSILESIKKIPDGFRNALNEAIQKVINELGGVLLNTVDPFFNILGDAIFIFTNNMFYDTLYNFLYDTFTRFLKAPDILERFDIIDIIANVMKPFGFSLLGLFFVIDFCKRTAYLETMTIENVVKPIFMLIIGKIFVDKSIWVLQQICHINNSIIIKLTDTITIGRTMFTMESLDEYTGIGKFLFAQYYLIIVAIILLCILVMIVNLIKRKIELVILVMLAPLFFATLSSATTMDTFKSYIKHFIVVCFETLIITIGFCTIKNGFNLFPEVACDTTGNYLLQTMVSLLSMLSMMFFTMGSRQLLSSIVGGGGSSGGGIIAPLASLVK